MEIKIKKVHTCYGLNKMLNPLSSVRVLFFVRGDINRVHEGVIFKNNSDIYLLSNSISGTRLSSTYNSIEEKKFINELIDKYHFEGVYKVSNDMNFFGTVVTYCYIWNDDLQSSYDSCIATNPKILNPIITKYGINTNTPLIKLIYLLSYGSPNYIAWAMKNILNHNLSLFTMINVFVWVNKYGNSVNKLSKGTITAYNSNREIYNMLSEMRSIRRNKRINDSINMFNTTQKKILKNSDIQEVDKDALAKMKRLNLVIQRNFVRKMSTIEDCKEIFSQLHHLVNTHFNWNKDSFIDYITNGDGMSCHIAYNKDNIVIIQVNDFETIKKIAKNSNWCISKNRQYWRNYINDDNASYTKQYIMCDFSKLETDVLSMIGFTVSRNRITAAHNFVNDNMMSNKPSFLDDKKSYLFLSNGIFSVLNTHNITLADITGNNIEEDKHKNNRRLALFKPQWEKTDIISYFMNMKEHGRTLIIKNDGTKLVTFTKDFNIKKLIRNIPTNIPLSISNSAICVFDFSKSYEEDGAFTIYFISNDMFGDNPHIIGRYNQYFESASIDLFSLFINEDIPLTLISGFEDESIVLNEIISEGYFNILDTLLNDTVYRENMKTISDDIEYALNTQLFELGNFDMLKILYKHGFKLRNICNEDYIRSIVYNLVRLIINNRRCMYIDFENEDYERMLNYEYSKSDDTFSINCKGYMTVFYLIMNNEGFGKDIYSQCSSLLNNSKFCETVAKCIANSININRPNDNLKHLIDYAIKRSKNFVFDILIERNICNKRVLESIINRIKSIGGDSSIIARFQKIYNAKYADSELFSQDNNKDEAKEIEDLTVKMNINKLLIDELNTTYSIRNR